MQYYYFFAYYILFLFCFFGFSCTVFAVCGPKCGKDERLAPPFGRVALRFGRKAWLQEYMAGLPGTAVCDIYKEELQYL